MLFKIITNIKMFGQKELVDFASASGDRKTDIFAPQVSTHTRAKLLSRSQEFYEITEINLLE